MTGVIRAAPASASVNRGMPIARNAKMLTAILTIAWDGRLKRKTPPVRAASRLVMAFVPPRQISSFTGRPTDIH